MILRDQLTVADRVPIFDGFLNVLHEVHVRVLKHLYNFLKVREGCRHPGLPADWQGAEVGGSGAVDT